MPNFIVHICTICGREKTGPGWFLVAENRWEDKLRVFQWDDRFATRSGVHGVCSAAHARELALHWMGTGTLSYPFARRDFLEPPNSDRLPHGLLETANSHLNASGAQELGALSVHRESIKRVLSESPNSLNAILDELASALRPKGGREVDLERDNISGGLANREA
jgi:hypothetical protein